MDIQQQIHALQERFAAIGDDLSPRDKEFALNELHALVEALNHDIEEYISKINALEAQK
jgi:hypothetical protein